MGGQAMTRDEIINLAISAGFHLFDAGRASMLHTTKAHYPEEYFERFAALVAAAERAKLYALPGAQNVPKTVAYLDLGVGGYMDIGTDLTDEELATLPKGRHTLGIIGTYGVDGYVPAQPAPSIPDGWLRAIDEALVVAHIGVANESDTYEQAKAKLDSLIGLHVDIATDPAVNGGWKLVPVEILDRFPEINQNNYNHDDVCNLNAWGVELVLAAAPEAKP